MATNDRLEAARRTGSLTNVIGAMRENAAAGAAEAPASGREQMNEVDAAIRVAAGLAGKSGVERRAVLREVRPGSTVTSQGVAKTRLTRAEKLARVQAWGATLSEAQRDEYIQGERFEQLTDRQQEVIAEAFGQIEEPDPTNIASPDFEWTANPVDIDSLPEDDTEEPGASFEVLEGEDTESFYDTDPWEGDVIS